MSLPWPPELSERDVATCAEKSKYKNKQQAKHVIRKYAKTGLQLYLYQCPMCHEFHLTKVPREQWREQQRTR